MLPRPALELVVPPPFVPLLTQMLQAFRSLLLPLLSPMPLLYHLQVPGKQAHWHQLGQLDQLVQLAKMLIVLLLPMTMPLMLLK